MKDGWIKLWRKISDSDMYAELTCQQRDVLIQCLLLANHEEKEWEWKGKLFQCQSGQFITSLNGLKKMCAFDVSIKNIRTALLKLEKWHFLANQSTKTGRIITICNWDAYQNKDYLTDKDIGKQLAKRRQRDGKETATNKNVKNDKNDKEVSNIYLIWNFYLKTFKGVYEPRKLTDKITKKIKARLIEYSVDEIKEALTNIRDNEFLCGKNDNGKVYAKPEYCFRNDEKIEEWLTKNLKPGEKIYKPGDKLSWGD